MVQRADFIIAIACVPCGPRRSLIYACAWGFWLCWKLSTAAVAMIKPDCRSACCGLHFYWLRWLCPVLLPLHSITYIYICEQMVTLLLDCILRCLLHFSFHSEIHYIGLCCELPEREARDLWCCSPVWNLRAVIWFLFPISSLVLLHSPLAVLSCHFCTSTSSAPYT